MDIWSIIVSILILFLFLYIFFRLIRIVPEQENFILEQFGKYHKTLCPGMHLVIPVLHRIAYRHTLKEQVVDVPPQICITKDNVQVEVDGILYIRVDDPVRASYGIENYRFAAVQLAQTTMRSEFGRIELDDTFAEREQINESIVKSVDEASETWGIKVTRYEIKDIIPSLTILESMESQMRAEREKRADILQSDGERQARINLSIGDKEEAINLSKGEKEKRINEAEGRAKAIELVATATATGLREVANAIKQPKGKSAVSLRIAEQFTSEFGYIVEKANTTVLPSDIANLKGILQTLTASVPNKPAESTK